MPTTTDGTAPGARLDRIREDVRSGLESEPRTLPPKYFYDAYGSELFERITELPEYYLTGAERALLENRVAPWLAEFAPRSLVELGAGSAAKTRVLLDAMPESGAVYAPLDVSAEFLNDTAERLDSHYESLEVRPLVDDLAGDFEVPDDLPRPLVMAFLGSTIGNFEHDDAVALLAHAARVLDRDDRFLVGLDLRKDAARLEAAYNDSAGVTAEFNLNVLRVLNRELDADFELDAFAHRAHYDDELGRVEMHLIATRPALVTIPEVGEFAFQPGQSIRTEISRKHDRAEVDAMLTEAGLSLEHWFSDGDYAVLVARPKP